MKGWYLQKIKGSDPFKRNLRLFNADSASLRKAQRLRLASGSTTPPTVGQLLTFGFSGAQIAGGVAACALSFGLLCVPAAVSVASGINGVSGAFGEDSLAIKHFGEAGRVIETVEGVLNVPKAVVKGAIPLANSAAGRLSVGGGAKAVTNFVDAGNKLVNSVDSIKDFPGVNSE